MAIKHALELLYGPGNPVPQDDVALISGIRIPCAADVPSYFMGISPADLGASRMVHCTAIGSYAIAVVDRKNNRAVKIETVTGILPRDRELLRLRKAVIMDKRSATPAEHRRFFDRLAELIVNFVRVGEKNFRVIGPTPFPWQEFSSKLSFVPGKWQAFRQFLQHADLSANLVGGLVAMEILNESRDVDFIQGLLTGTATPGSADSVEEIIPLNGAASPQTYTELINDPNLPTAEKVARVIQDYIAPVLENDGGNVDLLGFDANSGEVTVRFVGSCANCPSSILSVETLVKPPLLNIPGVHRVTHRTRLRTSDKPRVEKLPIKLMV